MYPWRFRARSALIPGWQSPLANIFLLRDAVLNVAFYVPLGAVAMLVLRSPWLALSLGAALSLSVELLQIHIPGRSGTMTDVAANTIGTLAGVAAARMVLRLHGSSRMARVGDRAAVALLCVWLVAWLFPLFPVLGRTVAGAKLRMLLDASTFSLLPFVDAVVVWLMLCHLMAAAGLRTFAWRIALVWLVPLQLFVITRQPEFSVLAGALAGTLFYRPRLLFAALLLLAVIVAGGLSPFAFAAAPATLSWMPFAGVLGDDRVHAVRVLIEKCFRYGAVLWGLSTAGYGLSVAGPLFAVVLAGIEVAQIWLPGRTAEATDPVLALLLAAAIYRLRRRSKS